LHLSLVIPAYNEVPRITATLSSVYDYFSCQSYEWEVILVDDGSEDNTGEHVKTNFPWVHVLDHEPNRGKGHAVKRGMLEARGAYRVYYDADGSTPIDEIDKLWPVFAAGADVIIGSRSLPDSDIQLRQNIIRETMGRTFNLFVKGILGQSFIDTQCGFKGFTARSTEITFPRQTMDRFAFDAELLHIAGRHGLIIKEIPVRWINSPESRVRIISDSTNMLIDLMRIRFNDLTGKYK